MQIILAFLNYLRCDRGQTMAEYGVLTAVIALVVVIATVTLGGSVSHLLSSTATRL
jgi:Flp pilus assembly pilin Flp